MFTTRHQLLNGTNGRGLIRNREAYLREKTLDHSGWLSILSRNITPSDIDAVVDNDGRIMLIELSCVTSNWNDIPNGQHRLNRNFVRIGNGLIMSVLALHRTPTNEDIDTIKNVVDFTVMYYQPGDILAIDDIRYKNYTGNNQWVRWINEWFHM